MADLADKDQQIDALLTQAHGLVEELRSTVVVASRRLRNATRDGDGDTL